VQDRTTAVLRHHDIHIIRLPVDRKPDFIPFFTDQCHIDNPDFVKGEYNTLFIAKNARMLQRSNGNNEEIENIAMIAAYMDYLMYHSVPLIAG